MPRSLTRNQSMVVKGITDELSSRVGQPITITDFFNSCLHEDLLTKMAERIRTVIDKKKEEVSRKTSEKKAKEAEKASEKASE